MANQTTWDLKGRVRLDFSTIRKAVDRPLRYVTLFLWVLGLAGQTSRRDVAGAIFLSVAARALVVAGFISALQSVSIVVSSAHRQQILKADGLWFLTEGMLVVLVACAIGLSLVFSGLASAGKLKLLERLGSAMSRQAQKRMVGLFQEELKDQTEPAVRRSKFMAYNGFETAMVGSIKGAAGNAVEALTGALLLAGTMIILAFTDIVLAFFVLLVVLGFGVFSVAFSHGQHLASVDEKRTRTADLGGKIIKLLGDFVDPDEDKRRSAREALSDLKIDAVIDPNSAKPGVGARARVARFLADPANAVILMSAMMFVFVIFYVYTQSLTGDVSIIHAAMMIFIGRYTIQFANTVVAQARRFSVRYGNVRVYYAIVHGEVSIMSQLALPIRKEEEDKAGDEDDGF